jgi:DNA polymerase III delta prime subunit
MKVLIDTFNTNGTIHHAYIIEGQKDSVIAQLQQFSEATLGLSTIGNPDFVLLDSETFTIDDSRDLYDRQLRKALGEKKVFIISFRFIAVEAQNALLKVLEEPTAGTHFFFVVPRSDMFLPTIRSRVLLIQSENTDKQLFEKEAKEFLKASPADRLAQVKAMVEEKDKGKAIDFLKAVEQLLAEDPKKNKSALEQILIVEKYLQDRSSSIKLLLEHVALVV